MVGGVDDTIMGCLRQTSTPPQDWFGISYGATREGTRQLKSYIQGRLARVKTNDSMNPTSQKTVALNPQIPSINPKGILLLMPAVPKLA